MSTQAHYSEDAIKRAHDSARDVLEAAADVIADHARHAVQLSRRFESACEHGDLGGDFIEIPAIADEFKRFAARLQAASEALRGGR